VTLISEKLSSRVDGFVGAYKDITHHEVLPLATTVPGIRILGHMVLVRRSRFQVPKLPIEIMSSHDQKKLGSFAAMTLLAESVQLIGETTGSSPNPFPDCCPVARVHYSHCVHRMREFGDRTSRITICDVPIRWHCQDLRRDFLVSPETAWLSAAPPGPHPVQQPTVSQLSAPLQRCCSMAKRNPECLAILSRAVERCLSRIRTVGEAQQHSDSAGIGPLRDPL
jgi:hypothetical protein